MFIKMLSTQKGSRNGITVESFKVNEAYDLPDSLAETFIKMGAAVISETVKSFNAAPFNKAILEPPIEDKANILEDKKLFESDVDTKEKQEEGKVKKRKY